MRDRLKSRPTSSSGDAYSAVWVERALVDRNHGARNVCDRDGRLYVRDADFSVVRLLAAACEALGFAAGGAVLHVDDLPVAECEDLEALMASSIRAEPLGRGLVEVTPMDVERVRFLGSPSVRVNGHDVEPGADERETFVFACRVYRTALGVSGLPPSEWVRAALTT